MNSRQPGISQRAYRIVVTDETGQEVWDSGTIEDDRSLNIEYAGEALHPTTRYHWKVNVWSQNTGKQNAGQTNTGSREEKPLSANPGSRRA